VHVLDSVHSEAWIVSALIQSAPAKRLAELMSSSEEIVVQDENLRIAELCFKAKRGDVDAAAELKTAFIERKALPFLRTASLILVRFVFTHILLSL
jgi:hypothetical protein